MAQLRKNERKIVKWKQECKWTLLPTRIVEAESIKENKVVVFKQSNSGFFSNFLNSDPSRSKKNIIIIISIYVYKYITHMSKAVKK